MKSFNEINLPESLSKAVAALNFETPTPIQSKAIPAGLARKDLLATAQTGSGKTAAFSLPLIARILEKPAETALVLAPTRELALQIADVMKDLTQFATQVRGAVLIGGAGMGHQLRALEKKPSIIIATPGRLMDHVRRRSVNLSTVATVVLDEADRMLDMGFSSQIEEIFEYIPKERQTLLFSATLPKEVLKLANQYMRSPERISIGEVNQAAAQIKQNMIQLPGTEKNERLLSELKERTHGSILIFTRTKIRTDRLAKFLKTNAMKVVSFHGGRTQSQRNGALESFRSLEYPIMVATDAAARGLDIRHIQTVVNFDLPQSREDYIHRIGRTARAGDSGEALSFVTPEEISHWRYISGVKIGGPGASAGKSGGAKFGGRRDFGKRNFRSGQATGFGSRRDFRSVPSNDTRQGNSEGVRQTGFQGTGPKRPFWKLTRSAQVNRGSRPQRGASYN